jgi:DNA helicase II / ATP-dependent DNA helicase PcrA
VYLVSMSDGAMPSVFADTEAELQEEERLLHVGITRARRQVQLSWASIGAKGRYNQPSPYLDLLSEPKRSRPHSGRGVKRSPVAASNRHFDRRR